MSDVSRRTLVKGAGWTVPPLVVVAAAPIVSASSKAILNLNYFEASRVYGAWSSADSASYFGGVTGSIGLFLTETAWNATPTTVTTMLLEFTVEKSAFGQSAPTVTSSQTGTWIATGFRVSGDKIIYSFSWTGTLKTYGGDRNTRLSFALSPSNNPPVIPHLSTAQRTIVWGATSPTSTTAGGSYVF